MNRETEWRMHAFRADFQQIARELNIDQVLARVVVNRGQDTPEKREKFLYGTLEDLPDPELLLNSRRAAELLAEKIREGKHIRIVSDYDVDGVTSNYVLLKGLQRLNAVVSYDIPDRVRDGYGMNERIVEEAARDGVDTLLTCDNGTAAFAAIHRAKELGMTVIVTDHHQVQETLPEADVLVNPWQPGCPYPFKTICGVEVAYKVLQILSRILGNPLEPRQYLEFVALGTVCDVMPLMEENRIIVREGLKCMVDTPCIGLRALMSVNGLLQKKPSVYHLGFILGPSINSEGRLSSASEALRLLLSEDPEEAEAMALEVKQLNDSRKEATEEGTKRAVEMLEPGEGQAPGNVIVVYIEQLHESLAGIVAGRIRERYYRPVIVFTDTESDAGMLKGSGRSIEGYNMFEKLSEVKELLDHFGGHEMAAGLSISRDKLNALREALNARDGLAPEQLIERVYIDVPMPLSYVSLPLAEQLEELEPFGTGNPKPRFAEKNLRIENVQILGKSGRTARLTLKNAAGFTSEVVAFMADELFRDIKLWSEQEECDRIEDISAGRKAGGPRIDIIYTVSVNEYMDRRSAQCELKYYRRSADA